MLHKLLNIKELQIGKMTIYSYLHIFALIDSNQSSRISLYKFR